MAAQADLLPSHSAKTLGAMKAVRTVKRATHNPNAADLFLCYDFGGALRFLFVFAAPDRNGVNLGAQADDL